MDLKNILINLKILIFLINISTSFLLKSQVQIGQTIYGSAYGDYLGNAVSMPDINTIGIGTFTGLVGSTIGYAQVWKWNGAQWVQKGSNIVSSEEYDDAGYSISMPDSNTIAVGAPGYGPPEGSVGQVRIFKWNGINWIQKGNDIYGDNLDDNLGSTIDMIDSNTFAVGAIKDVNSPNGPSYVKVFKWINNSWVQQGNNIYGDNILDLFGFSISLADTSTIAISDPLSDFNGYGSGRTKVYFWNGASWTLKGNVIYGEGIGDYFGFSVSMPNANTLAIGAPENYSSNMGFGYTRIYTYDGLTNSWLPKGSKIEGTSFGERSGESVSMPNSNFIAIGASHSDDNGSNTGKVRLFQWNGVSWQQKGSAILGEVVGEYLGSAISCADSNIVAIGSPSNNSSVYNGGSVSIYDFCPNKTVDNQIACPSLTWIDGITYTADNNIATYTLTNSSGCDSIITLNLTISVSDITTTLNNSTITTNNSNATYSWLDCDNNYAVIPNETGQSFTATINGNYAVQITENGCVDTSDCVSITSVGFKEIPFSDYLNVYPNPTSGKVTINFDEFQDYLKVDVYSIEGKLLESHESKMIKDFTFNLNSNDGIYLLKISSESMETTVRILKQGIN